MYKRRFVPARRDFPEGCGVPIRHRSNVGDSLMQSKFKASSTHSATETFRSEGLDYVRDVSTKDELIVESNGGFEDYQEKEVIGENEDKQNKNSPVKKRKLSLHNLTMEVGTDVISTSERVLVSGLAAGSKCPWRQPKNRGSKQEKRWKL